ncbi:MAG TPA: hypothetical protein PLQ81_06900, partial [bacterium]|nr:hypothetical protein [bacterium]
LALSIKKSVIEKINGDTDLTCDTTITDADISGKFQTVINEILNNDMSCSITLGVGLQFSAGDSSANVIVLSALYDAVSQTAKEYNLTNNQILVLTAQGNGYSGDQFSIYSASNFETPSLDVYSDAYDFTDDNIIKSYGGKIYIVNRTLSKVLVINGTTMKIEKEYKFAQGSNPHDIAFINSSKAYVTFYNSNIIGIFNPANGAELGTIDISGFDALKDGSAEADQLQIVGSKVFVTLQNISYSGGWATATENAKILVINSATDSVTDTISIHGLTNPYENKDYCEATGKLYFAFTGDWWGSPATGILEVDSSSHQTRVLCLGGSSNEDTIVNGAFTGVKVVSEDTGYCIYAGTWPNYYIGSFNPKTGVFYNKELLTGSFWGDLIKDGANNVYAVNRDSNYTASGLYKIFPNSICNFSGLNRTGSVKKNPIGAALFEN